jgi:hypothetical protein
MKSIVSGTARMRSRVAFDVFYWVSVGLVVIGFVVWLWAPAAHKVDWYYDEGINAIKAQLVLDGYALYRDIWSDQPPLFTILLAAAFALFGQAVLVGRVLVLGFAALTLVSTAIIGKYLAGRLGGLIALIGLILFPHFGQLSRTMLIGLPAMSVALAAFAAGFAFQTRRRPRFLVVAGILYGVSLMIKPLTAPLYLGLGALISLRSDGCRPSWAERLHLWLVFSAMVAVPIILALATFHGPILVRQVAGVYVRAQEEYGFSLRRNVGRITAYLFGDSLGLFEAGLLCLAATGLAGLALRRRWCHLLPMGLCLLAVSAALLCQSVLRDHQMIMMMPFFALLAGVGAQQAVMDLGELKKGHKLGLTHVIVLLSLSALVFTIVQLPTIARASYVRQKGAISRQPYDSADLSALRFIQSNTPPSSLIITDDPMLAFKAMRPIPVQLAVPSYRRIKVGELTPETLIELTKQRAPSAIVTLDRFKHLPQYVDWVRAHYCTARAFPDEKFISVPCAITAPRHASTEEGVHLLGSTMERLAVGPADPLRLDLYWRAERSVEEDYTLFVHLLDAAGHAWGQVDIRPLDSHYPTSRWHTGEIIRQTVELPLRSETPPGAKLIAVGLYNHTEQQRRLPMFDAHDNRFDGDQVFLAAKPVVRWAAQYDLPEPQYVEEFTLGDSVRFLGYDLSSDTVQDEGEVGLTLYWQCLAEMSTSYTVFAHLVDGNQALVAQGDHIPGQGQFPTTGWIPQEVIVDSVRIPIPRDVAPGTHRLAIGMYEPATGIRLPIRKPGEVLPEGRHLLDQSVYIVP